MSLVRALHIRAFVTSKLISGNQRRWWLLVTLLFQIVVLGFAALIASDLVPPALHVNGRQSWVYVLLIGLQGGPQVTMVCIATTILILYLQVYDER